MIRRPERPDEFHLVLSRPRLWGVGVPGPNVPRSAVSWTKRWRPVSSPWAGGARWGRIWRLPVAPANMREANLPVMNLRVGLQQAVWTAL